MEKKIQCFKCRNSFSDPNDLFLHIKHVHKICFKSKYSCTLCGEIFTKVGTYKTHVQKCFNEMDVEDEEAVSNRNEFIEAFNVVAMGNEDVENFKELIEKAAFEITCKLNAIMILPRDLVYKTIMDFEKFLKTVVIDESYINDFGLEQIFSNVIEELTKLATDGIVINVNSNEHTIFFVCGLFLADNKGANTCLGFQRSFSAIKFCRFCQLEKYVTESAASEIPATRRNRQNYNEDVLMHDAQETGIREYSTLNSIPYFHVTESSAEDLTHTVEEGIGKYNISDALHFLIYNEDDPPFPLRQLNTRMKNFAYSEDEKANKPNSITKEHLANSKLKMTAAETANFIHNLTFIIGDLVPEDSAVWYLILLTVKFFDYCYLPCYDNEDIREWRSLIDEMENTYINVLGQHLKPHHHIATHLPTDTLKYGPMRYARTIRFEGKHRELKSYAKNSNNRMNLSDSIAKKVQYNFADRLLQSRGLEDIIEAKYMPGTIKEKVYYAKLKSSVHEDRLAQQICYFTDKVKVNGMTFIRGMWLPDVPDDCNREIHKIHEICDIVLLSPTNIHDFYAVCKTYDTWPNAHYASYEVDLTSLRSEFEIINIGDFLENHYYPVTTHKIGEKVMFRCRRF